MQKNEVNIDILELYTIEGSGGFGALKEYFQVIPDNSVAPYCRKRVGNRIFINPGNYQYIKNFPAETIIDMLDLYEERKIAPK